MPARKKPSAKKTTKSVRKPSAAALSAARINILEQLRADIGLDPLGHVAGYDKGMGSFGRYGKD